MSGRNAKPLASAFALFLPYILFLLTLAAVFGLDYWLRVDDGDMRTGGLAFGTTVAMIALGGVGCLSLLYRGLSDQIGTASSIAIVAGSAVFGLLVYLAVALLYTFGAHLPL